MTRRKLFTMGLAILATMIVFALALPTNGLRAAQHGGHHHHGRGGGFGGFGPVGGFGVGLPYFFYPPIIVMGPGMFLAPVPMGMPIGPVMPPPPPGIMGSAPAANLRPARAKSLDPARAAQLLVVGDRLLRANNLKKAEERYLQAMRAAPDLAAPRVRLAQVAIARGNYAEAASRLREAETAEPGWIVTAPDIQAIFGEPTDFTRQIARIESHVQTHPDDRDAWLVLGAEWFLSGRTAKAADVFKRLDDPARKSDVALAAFLEASNQAGRPAGGER
jgi:tetratricopeptide (TPR) repeat protein